MSASDVRLVRAESAQDLGAVKDLFRAYAASLDFDLGFQDFEAELADFPGKYAQPSGLLLLARKGEMPVGTVALRDLCDAVCEMKRLYVLPQGRGAGTGRRLVESLIDEARGLHYRAMRLDSVRGHHDSAIALYRSLGFREIAAYCYNPLPDAVYLELTL